MVAYELVLRLKLQSRGHDQRLSYSRRVCVRFAGLKTERRYLMLLETCQAASVRLTHAGGASRGRGVQASGAHDAFFEWRRKLGGHERWLRYLAGPSGSHEKGIKKGRVRRGGRRRTSGASLRKHAV